MAENIPDGNQAPAEGAPQGHRTIKLTPLNVKPAPEEGAAPDQPVNTSTIKIKTKVSLKPKAVPPPASMAPAVNPAPMGMDTKTQAVPLAGLKKAGAPVSLKSDAAPTVVIPTVGKMPAPGSTTTVLSPKSGETETKGIPLSGLASVPQHESADDMQTSTVKLNRPSPKPMSTHSAPIATQSGPIPATPTKKMPIPTVTAPIKTAAPAPVPGAPTIRLGGTPAAAPVATSTTGIKLTGMPTKVSTSTTGIKLGGMPTAGKVSTATTNIKLGTPSPASSTVRLDGPVTAPAPAAPPAPAPEEKVSTSTTGIKLGGVPTPAASTVKLGAPAVPGAPVAPSLSIKKNKPEEPAPAPAGGEAPAEAPAEVEDVKKNAKQKKKKAAAPGGEPHILFSVSSIFALIAVILLAAIIAIQYANHWEGMQIQVPGLEFLTLGK